MEIKNIYSSFDNYGYEDEKLYSVLMDEDEVALFSEIQKQFGAIKAANKAAKRAWLERTGAGGFLGIGKRTGDSAVRNAREKLKGELLDSGRAVKSTDGWTYVPKESCAGIGRKLPKNFKTLDQKINVKGILDEERDSFISQKGGTKFRGRGLSIRRDTPTLKKTVTSRGSIYHDPGLDIRSLNTVRVK